MLAVSHYPHSTWGRKDKQVTRSRLWQVVSVIIWQLHGIIGTHFRGKHPGQGSQGSPSGEIPLIPQHL